MNEWTYRILFSHDSISCLHYRKANMQNCICIRFTVYTPFFGAMIVAVTTTIPFIYPHHNPLRERDISPIFMMMKLRPAIVKFLCLKKIAHIIREQSGLELLIQDFLPEREIPYIYWLALLLNWFTLRSTFVSWEKRSVLYVSCVTLLTQNKTK